MTTTHWDSLGPDAHLHPGTVDDCATCAGVNCDNGCGGYDRRVGEECGEPCM